LEEEEDDEEEEELLDEDSLIDFFDVYLTLNFSNGLL